MTRSTLDTREKTIKLTVYGTTAAAAFILVLLSISVLALDNHHAAPRLWVAACVLIALATSCALIIKNHVRSAGVVLLSVCYGVAFSSAIAWTINTPFTILMFGATILLSGSLFGSRAILPASLSTIAALIAVQSFTHVGLIESSVVHFSEGSTPADVAAYTAILSVFGLLAWVSGFEIEKNIKHLRHAQARLKEQNRLISNELQGEKEKLHQAQLEELATIYHFADIGRKSTALLHDLANQLAEIVLVDGGQALAKESRQTINSIEKLLKDFRGTLEENKQIEINPRQVVQKCADHLSGKLAKERITISLPESLKPATVYGDPLLLCQALEVLINNSIQAYRRSPKTKNRQMRITLRNSQKYIYIHVEDNAGGIPKEVRRHLFKLSDSSHSHGHGIGLYVSHQIITQHFGGQLRIIHQEQKKSTSTFEIRLPRYNLTA